MPDACSLYVHLVAPSVVFLVDVDNTLLDNDRFRDDVREHFAHELGEATRDLYWEIQERRFVDLGYRDYLGALEEAWLESGRDMRIAALSSYLLDYPFAERLYPGALDVLARFRSMGTAVALTDGESVFQPRKLERAGITAAVRGEVLVYVHKEEELDDVERRYPAKHYVLVDDKLRILTAFKEAWDGRVTTVFPRQGQFANDAAVVDELPPADITVERIGELLDVDFERLLG
jgi:FMN phosphatase YigB (HAD superfamily)